jgi:hypothetical protein
MISVDIYINNKLIETISAVNISEKSGHKYGKGKQYYQLTTTEEIIEHKYEDGATKLAIKMLRKLK